MRSLLAKWASLLTVVALMAGCGDDNGTGSGGNVSVPAHSGPNTPITASNAQVVAFTVAGSLNGTVGRILARAAAKQAVPAAAKSVSNVVVNGLSSGTATIKSGEFNVSQTGQTLKADIVFDDFSDDGQLFTGGNVNMDVTTSVSGNSVSFSLKQKGDLAFSGTYKGAMSMDLSISYGGGVPSVSGTITVDGNKVTLN